MSTELDTKPRYQTIKDFIRTAIAENTFPPGTRIPAENELATRFGVSRMTANRAIKELVADGILSRHQGLGTFVLQQQAESPLLEVRNIADEIRARHNIHSSEIHRFHEIPANEQLAGLLGVPAGEPVFHSLIVHKENGRPLQLADRYVNATLVPDYLQQDFSHMTPNEYLCELFPLSEIEHIVEAILPNQQERKLLRIDASEPCLLVNRRTWSSGRLISFARLIHPGSRYRLSSRAVVN